MAMPATNNILEIIRTAATGWLVVLLKKITYTDEKSAGANVTTLNPKITSTILEETSLDMP